MADRVGQQFGNYRLIRLLGRGGFAEVYLGQHLRLNMQAAIKVLYTQLADADVKHFHREAETIASLIHPHIVRVLDFDVQDGVPFLVMDYAPNGTLRRRYPRGTRLPLATIVLYVKQVALALQYAHDQHVIHRDVKPENMLLDRRNTVVLSDFGIALLAQSSRSLSTQEVAGTAAYMAPEQFQGKPRRASDQYALGVVVYEWVSGALPFHGSFSEMASQHLFAPPPPLHEKVPAISLDVERVIMTALEKEPLQRFESVQAFATALEQASQLAQFPTPSRSQAPTTLDQPRQPAQKASPMMPLSQQVIASPPSNVVYAVPAYPDQSQQTSGASGMLDRSEPASHGISRRTLLLGLAGLATVAAAGGGIAILLHAQPSTELQSSQNPTVGPPNPAINSSHAMFGFDPQHTHFNRDEHILSPTSVSRLVLYWTASTGGSIHSSPAVASGVVYVGSDKLYAFNAITGKTLWTASTGAGIGSSPAVANGVVYIGSDDHKLYAFNAATGKPLWTASTGDRVGSSPTVTGGVVYVGSWDHSFYAFNAATGEPLWTASADPGYWIFSSPAVANGVVYVGSYDHKLYAFNAATGKTLWTASTGYWIFSSPAVANGVVYIGSDDHKLYAFNATTGKTLWTASTGAAVESSPAVTNGVVYVGSWDQKLYAFNAITGKTLWTASTGAVIESSPTVANGVVYIGSRDYSIYAFNAATGKTLWTASTGGLINSSPAVANGVVYIGSYDHKLYAFHLPDSP